jgi:hypothetical protein
MSFENHFAHDEEFADFCVRLLNSVFKCNSFQKFGKRGESQDGIDIIDMSHSVPLRAAQCKLHEPHKTCPPDEIREEVRKAAGSGFELNEFYIITSGRKTAFADREILTLNGKKPYGQGFTTYLWSWQEIQTKLGELDAIAYDRVTNAGKNRSIENFKAVMSELRLEIAPNSLVPQSAELQTRFAKVEVHLKAESRELAKYELEQIDMMPAAMQSAQDRYLVHRLNAKFLMLVGDYDQAAKRFLQAFNEQPQLDQAMINRAVALELLGRKDEAWNQAEQLLSRAIKTEPLPAIAYRTAPKPHSDTTIAYYRDHLSTSEDLNLVIADEAREDRRFEDSIAACDRALEINASSSRARLLRAFAYHSLAVQGDRNLRRDRLEIAESDYQAARDNNTERLQEHLLPDLFRNLANVQFLLDRPEHAASFEEAIRVAKDKYPYVEQYLGYLCARTDFETAERILKQYGINDSQTNQRFLKLVVEKNRSSANDSDSFIQAMLNLYQEGEFDRRDECLGFVVQWSIDSGRAKEAIACLNSIKEGVDPFEFHCCMAWLQHIEKEDIEASKSASTAKSLLVPKSPPNYVYLLGRLFVDLDDDEAALPVLKQAADWSRLTPETRSLLDCAQRLQKHDVMLEVCRTLRKNKADTKQSRSLELQILYGYVPQKADELIHELVQQHSDDRQLYAWLCHIQTRLHGQFDALDVTRLPSASNSSVFDSPRVIGPLLAAGKFREAIRFAYEILRCNQGDEKAHGRYMWIFMQYAGKSDLQLVSSEVLPEFVVHYRETGGEIKSVIITNDLTGSRFDGEISPDSELGKELLHKKVGDDVTLSPQSLQPRVVKIKAVLSKYVYRYQQVLQNFQVNFPHANTIQMLKVMDGDELDISLFKRSLEERRKHIDTVLDLFKQNPLPISALATWIGIDYREAFEFLTTKPDIGIRCRLRDVSEPGGSAASDIDLKNKSLVLDQSTVLTIENLDLWKHLNNFQLVVMRSVADLFESHAEKLEDDRSKGTMMLSDSGQLYLHELSDDEKKSRVSRASILMENIRKNCRIEESLAAASVHGELRKAFGDVHAYPSLDSIAYAHSDSSFVLWTDEMFMQAVARNDFKIEPIGIQLILQLLRATGTISHEELATFTAKLLGWHYSPIEWNADVAFAAARLSNWDADCQPFAEVLRLFKGNHWPLLAKSSMALGLFIKIYRSDANRFRETQLLLKVMNAIGQGKAASIICSEAAAACFPDQKMLYSITRSIDIWEQGWLGR